MNLGLTRTQFNSHLLRSETFTKINVYISKKQECMKTFQLWLINDSLKMRSKFGCQNLFQPRNMLYTLLSLLWLQHVADRLSAVGHSVSHLVSWACLVYIVNAIKPWPVDWKFCLNWNAHATRKAAAKQQQHLSAKKAQRKCLNTCLCKCNPQPLHFERCF